MYFKINAHNNFLDWAKENGIKIDLDKIKSYQQYLDFEGLPKKIYKQPGEYSPAKVAGKDLPPVEIKQELLAEDKAQLRAMKDAAIAGDVVLLSKGYVKFMYYNNQYACVLAGKRDNKDEASLTELVKGLDTYCLIVDRNSELTYLVTTPKALSSFKKDFAKKIADMEKQREKLAAMYEPKEKAYQDAEQELDEIRMQLDSLTQNISQDNNSMQFFAKL